VGRRRTNPKEGRTLILIRILGSPVGKRRVETMQVSNRPLRYVAWAFVVAAIVWSWEGSEIRPLELLRHAGNMVEFAKDFVPPNFSDWRTYVKEMVVTFQIAVAGTFLAILASVPLGLLCAENMVPPWVWQPVRRLMDCARAINEMVFAMLFVVAVGLGPFAGVMALFVHTTGTLAKLYAEAVETIDPRPVEGIRATGAGRLEEILYGVLPQVLPLWLSYSLYRFEANVRSASVVGMVGAGGIGMVLWEVIRGFYFRETAAVMLLVVAGVTITDLVSAQIRKALV
jgi:phosphonate transport system permease protein